MAKKKKTIVPREAWVRFGILNAIGSFWSDNTFSTKEEAQRYLDNYTAEHKVVDLSRHTVIPVKVTIEALDK